MSDKLFNPNQAVYTPAEVSAYGLSAIKSIKERSQRAISLGINKIDDYFAPLLPGQLAAVIAQTSNYKSGFLHCVEKHAAEQIQREKRKEILIHVSVEEDIEQQSFYMLSREAGEDAGRLARGDVQNWQKLNEAANYVGTVPIYRIGESMARADDFPYLSISNMIRAIKVIADGRVTDEKLPIAGLFFDYLQAFPIDNEMANKGKLEAQRRLQVREDIFRLRQAASYFRCPVFVAVQAKQTLSTSYNAGIKMPGIYDGEESSAIAQRADRIIQLAMPKMSEPIGSEIKISSTQFISVEDDMLFVKVGKQRGGLPSGITYQCKIDFNRNEIKAI